MVEIAWISCPHCDFSFYAEAAQLLSDQRDEVHWFCPSCKNIFSYADLDKKKIKDLKSK
jgi:hypothetical protein